MAKANIIGTDGAQLETGACVPKVSGVRPFGGTVLIEILNPDEVLGTKLYINKEAKVGSAPQAYVLALGTNLNSDCGLKVGDRIMVQGSFVPVDNVSDGKRAWGIIEIHNIKAILDESDSSF